MTAGVDGEIRAAAFAWLDEVTLRHPDGVPSRVINKFVFDGRGQPLIVQSGIWKPASCRAALSIRTTYTPPNVVPPYADDLDESGLLRYKFRGDDPHHSDNRALRLAEESGTPLIYFAAVAKAVYQAIYPVWIEAEDRHRLDFLVAVDPAQRPARGPVDMVWPDRRYSLELTKRRLHQPLFRARVLRAYADSCAVCRLKMTSLLDAAHIIPDGQPNGLAVVPNGLSLCKIHHAAYDANVLGVRRDLKVEINARVLADSDGPMLRHGLQEMNGVRLIVPRARQSRPDPDRLDQRYEDFRKAG